MKNISLLTLWVLTISLTSCGWIPKQNEYEKVGEGRPLEVPPDLDEPDTTSGVRIPNATYSAVRGGPVDVQTPDQQLAAVEGAQVLDYQGDQVLVLTDGMNSAWRRVGFALDRIGVEVEEAREEARVYLVEYVDVDAREQRPGVFARWVLRRKGPTDHSGVYQLRLRSHNDALTLIDLRGENGGRAAEPVKDAILNSLRDRLG